MTDSEDKLIDVYNTTMLLCMGQHVATEILSVKGGPKIEDGLKVWCRVQQCYVSSVNNSHQKSHVHLCQRVETSEHFMSAANLHQLMSATLFTTALANQH
jgi:hypothetical protein